MNTEERQAFWNALCSAKGNDLQEDSHMISAAIAEPRFLFRYRPVNVSSIDALQTNRLYFSKANYYDDPFDTMIKIDYDLLHEHILHMFSSGNIYQQFESMCNVFSIPEEERLATERIVRTFSLEEIINNADAFLRNNIQSVLKESLWTVCFSEIGDNETMWLKYADQYKGFCVVYDLDDSEKKLCGKQEKCEKCIVNTAGVSLYPVYYSDTGYDATEYARSLAISMILRQKIPHLAERFIQYLPAGHWEQERITLIKSKCHEYDQEWRMILRSQANGPIMQEWIPHGVILGLRTSEQERNIILRSAKIAGIKHFFETYINNSNRLDVREIQIAGIDT